MAETLTIDVVDVSVPSKRAVNIAIINQPNPVSGYEITYDDLLFLLNFPQYYINESASGKPVTGETIYDYFPDKKPTPGPSPSPGPGPDPEPGPTKYNVPWGYAYPKPVYFIGIIAEKIHHD